MSYDVTETMAAIRTILRENNYEFYIEGETVESPGERFVVLQGVMVTPDKHWQIMGYHQHVQIQAVSRQTISAGPSRAFAGEIANLLTSNGFFVDSIRSGIESEGSISTVVSVRHIN